MSAIMTNEKIYTVNEVAEILRTRPRTIWKMINDGELNAFRVRNEYRIRQSEIEAFIGRQERKKDK